VTTQNLQTARSIWPINQLLVTADTSEAVDALLHPRSQLKFLGDMTEFAGPHLFADALVYSTPRGNTGWTALRMGHLGHITYHHWDAARPNLLQLDVLGIGPINEGAAVEVIKDFWVPLGMRAIVVKRPAPPAKISVTVRRDDVSPRTGHDGLGPGEHLHLFVDQSGPARRRPVEPSVLDTALMTLVTSLRMRGMTPVMSHHQKHRDGFSHDAIVGITTSHMSLRMRQNEGMVAIALDVFSCRNFEPEEVFRWLDGLLPTPEARRSVLYNRYPAGTFQEL